MQPLSVQAAFATHSLWAAGVETRAAPKLLQRLARIAAWLAAAVGRWKPKVAAACRWAMDKRTASPTPRVLGQPSHAPRARLEVAWLAVEASAPERLAEDQEPWTLPVQWKAQTLLPADLR
jgi:hypothetical protein